MIDEKKFQGVQKDILFAEKKNQLVDEQNPGWGDLSDSFT